MQEQSEAKRKVLSTGNPDSVSMNALSIVMAGANEARRKALGTALAGTPSQIVRSISLPALDDLQAALAQDCDVLIVDLNEETERGLEIVETACALQPTITVMVYSSLIDPDLLVRCMRAGAREFLKDPLTPAAITDALVHAAVRRDEVKRQKKSPGKCLVFVGAKGGSGVTTIATNFGVALARESGESVVLVDLDIRLGDAALTLGLRSEFSVLDALQNESRLDSDLVSKLLVRHDSGLQVLAAPDEHNSFYADKSGVLKLLGVLRNEFAWVLVDAGTHYNGFGPALFEMAEKVYLVTQVSVTELRNSNRFISAFFKDDASSRLSVILNRFAHRAGEIDSDSIRKALTVEPAWKIPSDFGVVRWAQNAAAAIVSKDNPISRIISGMARAACGKDSAQQTRKRFGLFRSSAKA